MHQKKETILLEVNGEMISVFHTNDNNKSLYDQPGGIENTMQAIEEGLKKGETSKRIPYSNFEALICWEIAYGLPVNIYYNDQFRKCANGGITETAEKGLLIEEGLRPPFKVTKKDVVFGLVRRQISLEKNAPPYIHATHLQPNQSPKTPMFGGNFIHTSGSRFREINPYPIPVHDRIE